MYILHIYKYVIENFNCCKRYLCSSELCTKSWRNFFFMWMYILINTFICHLNPGALNKTQETICCHLCQHANVKQVSDQSVSHVSCLQLWSLYHHLTIFCRKVCWQNKCEVRWEMWFIQSKLFAAFKNLCQAFELQPVAKRATKTRQRRRATGWIRMS